MERVADGLCCGPKYRDLEGAATAVAQVAMDARRRLVEYEEACKATGATEDEYHLAEALLLAIALTAMRGGGCILSDCAGGTFPDRVQESVLPPSEEALHVCYLLSRLALQAFPPPPWDRKREEKEAIHA